MRQTDDDRRYLIDETDVKKRKKLKSLKRPYTCFSTREENYGPRRERQAVYAFYASDRRLGGVYSDLEGSRFNHLRLPMRLKVS